MAPLRNRDEGMKKCIWIKKRKGYCTYYVKCGNFVTTRRPGEKYCPYCGKEIEVKELIIGENI